MNQRKHSRAQVARAWHDEPGIGLLQCSDAPDTSGMNEAAVMQANLSKEQLEFAKQLYADTTPAREAAAARQAAISDQQLSSMQFQDKLMRDQASDWKETFKPIDQKIARDALAYDTTERREAEAGQAMADVGSQVDLARLGVQRELDSRGVDASSGNSAVALSRMALGEGAAKAAAGNAARKQVETIGQARLMDAAGVGRGVISNQATTAGVALNAGNSSGANAGNSVNTATSGAQIMNQGYAGAQSGLAGAANTYGQIAKAQNDSGGGLMEGLAGAGKIAGMAMAFSDEDMKEDKKPVKKRAALSAVKKMPVSQWRYKKDSPANDGGRAHIGPMAQDVQKATGGAASDGTQVDLVSMNGVTMAAVQELAEKNERLERKVARLSAHKNSRPRRQAAAA